MSDGEAYPVIYFSPLNHILANLLIITMDTIIMCSSITHESHQEVFSGSFRIQNA